MELPRIWSTDDVEFTKKMWSLGWTATQIGLRINKTRSAVMGKLYRMGMTGMADRVRAVPTVRVISSTVEKPKRPPKRPPKRRTARPKLVEVKMASPPPKEALPPPEDGVGLLQLRYNVHCCYPIKGRGADMRYCGGGTDGKRYCERHQKIMYVAPYRVLTGRNARYR